MTNDNQRMVPAITIEQALDCWVVKVNGVVAMMHCPYCLKPFATREHAQRVVDVLWPSKGIDIGS